MKNIRLALKTCFMSVRQTNVEWLFECIFVWLHDSQISIIVVCIEDSLRCEWLCLLSSCGHRGNCDTTTHLWLFDWVHPLSQCCHHSVTWWVHLLVQWRHYSSSIGRQKHLMMFYVLWWMWLFTGCRCHGNTLISVITTQETGAGPVNYDTEPTLTRAAENLHQRSVTQVFFKFTAWSKFMSSRLLILYVVVVPDCDHRRAANTSVHCPHCL